jgi:hypothetical protein
MTVWTLPWLRRTTKKAGLRQLIGEARRRERRRRYGSLALLLAVAAISVGAFFFMRHPGGPDPPGPAAHGHVLRVENAGIRDRFVRFADLPRSAPRFRGIPRDVRAGSRMVGHVQDTTIFAAPTRDGYWEMFARHKHGGWGGGRPWRVTIKRHPAPPNGWRVGGGGLYTQNGYPAIVSGSTIVSPGAKLLLVYADGTRERIKVTWVSRPIGAGFYYRVISKEHRLRARRVVVLELRRDGQVVTRQVMPVLRPLPIVGSGAH